MEDEKVINVLGTDWKIVYTAKDQDSMLEYNIGYEDHTVHTIVLRASPMDEEAHDQEYLRQEVLRHEVIHAFLDECGLADSSYNGWAVNEEMVDWFARIGPKIFETWQRLGIMPPQDE